MTHTQTSTPDTQRAVRETCAVCWRPLAEFPHATFSVTDFDAAYHGELRAVANRYADVYVFGYGEFHIRAERVVLTAVQR